GAIVRGNDIGETTKQLVADGELLKREEIPRIQFYRALQIAHSVFVRTSATRHETGQLEDPRRIGHRAASDFELRQGAIVIAISRVVMIGAGEVCFTSIWLQPRQRFESLLS